ncbi:MAG TPA: hypothetical protein VGX03_08785, partial [Candidatus Binatia bacterium]|nr:hypothetical protein [Candidatus Binatia bacterium]
VRAEPVEACTGTLSAARKSLVNRNLVLVSLRKRYCVFLQGGEFWTHCHHHREQAAGGKLNTMRRVPA